MPGQLREKTQVYRTPHSAVTHQQRDNWLQLQKVETEKPSDELLASSRVSRADRKQNSEDPNSSTQPRPARLRRHTRRAVLATADPRTAPAPGPAAPHQAAPGADEVDPGGVGGLPPLAGGAGRAVHVLYQQAAALLHHGACLGNPQVTDGDYLGKHTLREKNENK